MNKYFKQMERLRDLLSHLENKRIEEIGHSFEDNEEYLRLSERERILYQRLHDALPEECRPSLVEYTDIYNDTIALQENYIYRNGFRDAIVMVQMMIDWGNTMNLMKRYMDPNETYHRGKES